MHALYGAFEVVAVKCVKRFVIAIDINNTKHCKTLINLLLNELNHSIKVFFFVFFLQEAPDRTKR